MRNRSDKDYSNAFHEAGHAAIALALGLTVVQVTIKPTKEFDGTCRVAFDSANRDHLRADLLADLAGDFACAKWECRKRETFTDYAPGARNDIETFERNLSAYCRTHGRDIDKSRQMLFQEARNLVDEHWLQIVHIAGALLAYDTIAPAQS